MRGEEIGVMAFVIVLVGALAILAVVSIKTHTRYAYLGPADPASTNSAAGVMMGLGSTCKYTPHGSGNLTITWQGDGFITGAVPPQAIAIDDFNYGTGTAPSNGAAITGTSANLRDVVLAADFTGATVNFAHTDVITGLTKNTQYWFDVSLRAIGGGFNANLERMSCVISESP